MLVSPDTWLPVSRCEDVLAALPDEVADCARAETHGSALELATPPHATVAEAVAAARRAAGRARRHARRARDARGRRGHAPVRALGGHRRLAGRPLPVRARVDARAGAARADLRAARPRRGAGPRGGGPRAERDAAHLPVLLALSGNSPFWQGRDSGLASARTPAFQASRAPARRAGSATTPTTSRRSTSDALRRDPRADVHVVGRPPAAALRHARGADHGRADAGRGHGALAALVQCLVRLAARGGRARRDRRARGRRREPLHRRARRHGGGAHRPAGVGPARRSATGSRRCSTPARRTPARSAAWPSCRTCRRSPSRRAPTASGRWPSASGSTAWSRRSARSS